MPLSRKKRGNPLKLYLIAATAALFVGIITFQALRRAIGRFASDFFYPYLSAPAEVSGILKNKSLLLKSKLSLAKEVEELRRENDKLTAQATDLKSISQENSELRKILKLKKRLGYKCVFAEIILRDPVFWEESFTINKGSNNGIKPGAIVLCATPSPETGKPVQTALGRVKSVSAHSSIVSTILSKDCRLSARILNSSSTGITSGGLRQEGSFFARIAYLPKGLKYSEGTKVVTSGMSVQTPPGLYLGKLAGKGSQIKIQNNLYVEAVFKPAANFENIRFVMAMIKEHGDDE